MYIEFQRNGTYNYIAKVDLSDGFYRLPLNIHDIPKLGMLFPKHPHEDTMVGLLLVLSMYWVHSPHFF